MNSQQVGHINKGNLNVESIFLMLFKAWLASPAGHLSEATFCHPRTCDGEAHNGRAANAQAGETSVEEESDVKYANYGEGRKRPESPGGR